jgi:DNA mismatch repair ATPase MutS
VKPIHVRLESEFGITFREPILCGKFDVDIVEFLCCRGHPGAVCAVSALLNFVLRTPQVDGQGRVLCSSLELFDLGDSLQLEEAALRNLEAIQTLRDGPAGKSPRWAVDHTVSAKGACRVRNLRLSPLVGP